LSPRVELEVETLSESHDVSILSWNRSGEKLDKDGTTFVDLAAPEGRLRLMVYVPLLYALFFRAIWRRDVDLIHCTHILFLPLAVLIGLIRRIPIVYDVYERHAIEISYYFPRSRWVRQFLEWFENQLCKRVALILTVDTPHNILERRYRSVCDNVYVLYNVPRIDEVVKPSPNIRDEYESSEVLVYVGGISKAKGGLKAIEAFERVVHEHDEARLVLIGSFKDSRDDLFEFARSHDLEEQVEHVEWLEYEKMMEYLAVADVGLALHQPVRKFEYVSTGTGRKFFTYMEAGLPIVGPTFREIGEVVRETDCGILVDTTDAEAVATALLELLEEPARRETLGERGRRALEHRYNWETEAEKLRDGYSTIDTGE
jgi:glycosyltransferase involved in cell wall biosynthesis